MEILYEVTKKHLSYFLNLRHHIRCLFIFLYIKMFIISAIDKDCKLLDFDVVNKRNLDITVAKYQTKGYDAFDIEELDEKYDYLQDDLEVLEGLIELGYSLGMTIKEFIEFMHKDIDINDDADKVREKLTNRIKKKAEEIED